MDWDVFFAIIGVAFACGVGGAGWVFFGSFYDYINDSKEVGAVWPIVSGIATVILVILAALCFAAADNPDDYTYSWTPTTTSSTT